MIRMASMFCSIVTFWKEKLDNTGCYLCSHLIHSLASLRECTGIKIVRYDFSDPQAGKYLFDRRTATVQSHVCCNINEGHDSKSASDIQWPVEGCQASITLLRVKSQARPRSTQCLGSCLEIFLASSPEVWKCRRLMVWALVNVSHLHMRNGFGRPQRPTDLCIEQSLKCT